MEFEKLAKGIGVADAVVTCWPTVPQDAIQKMSLKNLCTIFQMVQGDPLKSDLKSLAIAKIIKARRNFRFWSELLRNTWHTPENSSIEEKIIDKMVGCAASFSDLLVILEFVGHRKNLSGLEKETVAKAMNFEGKVSFSEWQSFYSQLFWLKIYKSDRKQVFKKMVDTAQTLEDWLSIYFDSDIHESDSRKLAISKLSDLAKGLDEWLGLYRKLRRHIGNKEATEEDELMKLVVDKMTSLAGINFDAWLKVYYGVDWDRKFKGVAHDRVVELASTTEKILRLYNENEFGRGEFEYRGKIAQVITSFEEGLAVCEKIDAIRSVLEKMLEFADTDERLLKLYSLSNGEVREAVRVKIRERVKI